MFHTHSPTLNNWNTSVREANISENSTEKAEKRHIELAVVPSYFDVNDGRLTPTAAV